MIKQTAKNNGYNTQKIMKTNTRNNNQMNRAGWKGNTGQNLHSSKNISYQYTRNSNIRVAYRVRNTVKMMITVNTCQKDKCDKRGVSRHNCGQCKKVYIYIYRTDKTEIQNLI